jgi:hypothetical protein
MTTSSAVAKLMVILGEEENCEAAIRSFIKPWAGEISE